MTKTYQNKLSITINFTIHDAENAKKSIIAFLQENMVDEEIISCIELAAYEAVVNIIEHAKYDESIPITLTVAIIADTITTSISHSGNEFDITKVKLPDIVTHYKSGKKRGLGIYFIRTLMDTVTYSFNNRMNTLVLEKHINS